MNDVLLTHGYFLEEDPKEREVMKPYPPLGLLYVAAYLRRVGMGVEVFDTTFATREALGARLAATPAGVLGIYTNLITRASVLDVVARAKLHGWTVVLGGPEAANYPAEYLACGADVVVFGEGEETMVELLPALAARGRTGCMASPARPFWTKVALSSRILTARKSVTSMRSRGRIATRSTS